MSAKFKAVSVKKDAAKRQTFTLTAKEQAAFAMLPTTLQTGYKTWQFWREVCGSRGLDYQTVVCNPYQPGTFSALPLGHGKHWCWPSPLECKVRPETVMT